MYFCRLTMLGITLIAALVPGFVVAVLPHVVWLLAWMVGKGFNYTMPYAPFGWTALALVVVVWMVLTWGCFVGRWRLLRNENTVVERVGERLTLVGVDNTVGEGQGFSTIDRGDLPKAMAGTDGFRILLTHDPSHWHSEVLPDTDIPLTLSGHTHSAQVRLFGWTPASWMFKEAWGRYDEDGQTLIVNAGLGCTLPVRVNCPAEITIVTLRKK